MDEITASDSAALTTETASVVSFYSVSDTFSANTSFTDGSDAEYTLNDSCSLTTETATVLDFVPKSGSDTWAGLTTESAERQFQLADSATMAESARLAQRIELNLSSPGGSIIRVETLSIDIELNRRATCSFEAIYQGGGAYRPQVGHEVKVTDYDGTTVLFAGSIDRTDETIYWQPDGNHYLSIRCEAVGWEQILDRYLVPTAEWTTQSFAAIVGDLIFAKQGVSSSYMSAPNPVIIDSWGEIYDIQGPDPGPTIESFSTQYDRLSDAFTSLAELAGYWWRVTHDRIVTFYDPASATASGVTFSKASANWLSMSSARDRANYRNTQYMTNALNVFYTSESWGTDGLKRAWNIDYPIYELKEVVRQSDEYAYTFGIAGKDTGKDWYYTPGTNYVYMADSTATIGSANAIIFRYDAQQPIVLRYGDGSQVADRRSAEGNSGIYEAAYQDELTINGTDTIGLLAQSLVDQYAPIGQTVTIETDTSGILPGETVALDVSEMGLSGNYFVSRVSSRDVQGKRLRHTVVCHSSLPEEAWRAVFQRKAQTSIRNSTLTNYP